MIKQLLFIWLISLALNSAEAVSKQHGKLLNNQRRVLSFDEVKMLKGSSLSSFQDDSLKQLFRQHSQQSNIKTLSMVREIDLYADAENPDHEGDEASERLRFIDQQTKLSLGVFKDLLRKDKTMALSYTSHNIRAPQPFCPAIPKVQCNDTINGTLPLFRNIDGSCNNLQNWWWGMSLTPYKRLLPSNYDDNVEEPRYSSVIPKKKLPNPRQIALDIFRHKETVSIWTKYFVMFGQFIAHDVAHTLPCLKNDTCAPYCAKECLCHNAHKDRDCYNIPIPKYDYYNTDQTCMPMPRSSPSVRDFECSLGPREQLNFNTHWLDLSQLYGNLNDKAQSLRSFVNGTLTSRVGDNGREFLPTATNQTNTCNNKYKPAVSIHSAFECYNTGDSRTEHNTWLTSIQTVFLREHNKIARELAEINPHWDDETLYQVTRRIVIAEYQNIVYAEYLPSTVGPQLSSLYKLPTLKYGFFTGYKSKLYPQVINEFTTAAFRFGHTIIPETSFLADHDFKMHRNYGHRPLDFFMFNDELYNNSMSDVLRGSLVGASYDAWPQSNKVLGDWLFNGLFSSARRWSIPALNIHRGRDHGIPGYNRFRKLCGLREAKKFEDFGDYMSKETISKLKQLYASPMDVDLFVGAVSEFPVKGGIVGPTGGCIIAKQFHDLKYGDRFYFETEDPKIRFSMYQLNNIRYTSGMARLLCENTDIRYVQEWPFFVPNIQSNRYMECHRFKSLNLTLWREDPPPGFVLPTVAPVTTALPVTTAAPATTAAPVTPSG